MYSTQDSFAWNTFSFTAYGHEVYNTKIFGLQFGLICIFLTSIDGVE